MPQTLKSLIRTSFLFVIILFSFRASANLPTQRLMIPKIEEAVVAKNGEIILPAFCTDIGREWPDGALRFISWGGTETTLRIKVNDQVQRVGLNAALAKGWIKVISEANSIAIRKANASVKIISIQSSGFLIGKLNETAPINMSEFLAQMPSVVADFQNGPNYLYYRYQQQWWRAVYHSEKINVTGLQKRMQEIAIKHFSKKGLEIRKIEGGRIVLFDKGNNLKSIHSFYNNEQVSLYQLERLHIEEYDDWEICLNFNPTDSSLFSFTISGKLQNIIPFELEYNSSNELSVTTSVKKEVELTAGMSLESGINIQIDPEKRKAVANYPLKECAIKFTGKLCIPSGISADIEVCGVTVSIKPQSFGFVESY